MIVGGVGLGAVTLISLAFVIKKRNKRVKTNREE